MLTAALLLHPTSTNPCSCWGISTIYVKETVRGQVKEAMKNNLASIWQASRPVLLISSAISFGLILMQMSQVRRTAVEVEGYLRPCQCLVDGIVEDLPCKPILELVCQAQESWRCKYPAHNVCATHQAMGHQPVNGLGCSLRDVLPHNSCSIDQAFLPLQSAGHPHSSSLSLTERAAAC